MSQGWTLSPRKYLLQLTIGMRLMLFTSVLLIVVVYSLGALYNYHERDVRIRESERQLRIEVERQANMIEEWVQDRADNVKAVAQLTSVRENDSSRMLEDFRASLGNSSDFSGYAFVDQSGRTRVDTISAPSIDVSTREYFRYGLQGKPFITDILVGRATGQELIIFSHPVHDKNNHITGVIFATVALHKLESVVNNFAYGQTGRAYLVDNLGKIIACSAGNQQPASQLAANEGFVRAKMEESGSGRYYNHNGQAVIGAYHWIRDRNWTLLLEVNEEEVLAPLSEYLRRAIAGSMLILLFALYLAWLMAKNIQKPILTLYSAAQATQVGHYSHTIPESQFSAAPLEIRGLCHAFNTMLQAINERVCQLNGANEALAAAEHKYRILSTQDQLTQIYNRTYFEAEVRRLQTLQITPMAIVACDVDGLKLTNDILGHKAGDMVIQTVAEYLVNCFPPTATVARIGGDEFMVLLPHGGEAAIQAGLAYLNQAVDEHNQQYPELPIAVSSGGASAIELPLRMEELIIQADNNMYQEKNRHRNEKQAHLLAALTRIKEDLACAK